MCRLQCTVVLCLSVFILECGALNCRIRYGPGKESKWMKIYHTCLKMLEKAHIALRSDKMFRSLIKPITPSGLDKLNSALNEKIELSLKADKLSRVLISESTTTEGDYFYTLDDGNDDEEESTEGEEEEEDRSYSSNCVHGDDCAKGKDDNSEESARPVRTNRQRRRTRLEFHFGRRDRYKPNSKRNPNNRDGPSDQSWQNRDESTGVNDNACALHCFVDALKMTDETGFPNRHLVRQVMTKDIEDQELKDFLQESADDCFQILRANKVNKCEYSKNLLICLTDKGKANCDDLKSNEPGMVAGVPKAYSYTFIKHLRP